MAPLQRSMCSPCETGVHTGPMGKQYFDLDGHTNAACGRPDEKHGMQGSWTHGVTVLSGGVPHDVRPPTETTNHGIVLFRSSNPALKPNVRDELMIKPGTKDERQGSTALFRTTMTPYRDVPVVQKTELCHGIVLTVCPNMKPTLSWEGQTNVIGGRPDERLGAKGGFTTGIRMFLGGEPCSDIPSQESGNRGTVLFTSSNLRPDMRQQPMIKPGTDGERRGRCGSFEHGDSRLRMPTAAEAALWKEAGQKGGRRYGPGHFLAGTTIMSGAVPCYCH